MDELQTVAVEEVALEGRKGEGRLCKPMQTL
jgi:hypothetical protein